MSAGSRKDIAVSLRMRMAFVIIYVSDRDSTCKCAILVSKATFFSLVIDLIKDCTDKKRNMLTTEFT